MTKIIVPIYKSDLSATEKLSLDRLKKVMGHHDIVIVKPTSLDIASIEAVYGWPSENFSDAYFLSVQTYNYLMLSQEFYARFADDEYLLIYQTDAYVFTDNLAEWIAKGYDYIGAPWIPVAHQFLLEPERHKFRRLFHFRTPDIFHYKKHYLVGNGGFSLRRTARMLELTRRYKEQITDMLRRGESEDLILAGLLPSQTDCQINTPDYREALGFAFEMHIPILIKMTDNLLPMGSHAWHPIGSKIFDFRTGKILDPDVKFCTPSRDGAAK